MKKILKASFILGLSTFITLITGVIKNKFLAVFLGPVGIGTLAQINSFLNATNTVSSLGLSQGVTKYVAEGLTFKDPYTRLKGILRSAGKITLSVSTLFLLLTIIFSRGLAGSLLNNNSAFIFFLIIASAIPLQAITQMLISFVQGFKAVKTVSLVSIFISIAGFIVFVPLVLFFRINGAVIGILIFAVIGFFAFWLSAKKLLKNIHREKEDRPSVFYSRQLLEFGYLRLIQTSVYPLTILVVRSLIIKKLGVFSNGLYEAALAYSFMFVPLINNILWTYSYPNYCSAKDNAELLKEVNQFLKVSLFIAVPIITFIIVFRRFLLQLLFSAEFLPAMEIISIQLMGDFLRVLIWPFNVVLMARDKMKIAVFFEITWNVAFLVLALLSVGTYKLKGVLVMQNISLFLCFFLTYLYTKKKFELRMTRNNLLLVLISISIIVITNFLNPRL